MLCWLLPPRMDLLSLCLCREFKLDRLIHLTLLNMSDWSSHESTGIKNSWTNSKWLNPEYKRSNYDADAGAISSVLAVRSAERSSTFMTTNPKSSTEGLRERGLDSVQDSPGFRDTAGQNTCPVVQVQSSSGGQRESCPGLIHCFTQHVIYSAVLRFNGLFYR